MTGDPFAFMYDFNQAAGEAYIYFFFDKLLRNAVVILLHFNVIIYVNGQRFP